MPSKKIDIVNNAHIAWVAANNGYTDWRVLWGENGGLSAKRKHPHILFHGDRNKDVKHTTSAGVEEIGAAPDVIEIPEPAPKTESGAVDAHHPFSTARETLFLRLRVLDEEFAAIKDASWKLTVDGKEYPDGSDGKFGADGLIEVEVSRQAQRGKLVVKWTPPPMKKAEETPPSTSPPPVSTTPSTTPTPPAPEKPIQVEFVLELGRLDPIREEAPDAKCLAGVQQRLNNLAFGAGTVDGVDGPVTQGAIRRFQRFAKLTVNGTSDAATQDKLYELHDQPKTPPKEKLTDEPGVALTDPPPTTSSDGPSTPPPTDPVEPVKKYKKTLEEGHALESEVRGRHAGYGTVSWNGYGSGTDKFVCTTYAVEVLKRCDYEITKEISDRINIVGLGMGHTLENHFNSNDERLKGIVLALTKAGLGREVTVAELKPGDFVQYWYRDTKNKLAGHTAQVERVVATGKVDLHGAHDSKKGMGVLVSVNLNTKLKVYAVRPAGNE